MRREFAAGLFACTGSTRCFRLAEKIALGLIVLVGAAAAQGVIVHPDASLSTSNPALTATYATFPYWNYVGLVNGGTGVYLDNGWVLTANHVGAGNISLNGQTYYRDTAVPTVRLYDPDQPSLYADLLLFKLTQHLSLAPMRIAASEPQLGQDVLLIGGGYARAATSTTWDVNTSIQPWTWSTPATNPSLQDITGYLTQSPRAVRWGDNRVSDRTVRYNPGARPVYRFATQFNSTGTAYESQAVDGDSGGGVWTLSAGNWELLGVMLSVTVLSGQPSDIASGMLDYSKTYAADLSHYRDQINQAIFEAAIPGDLNDDKALNSLDIAPFATALTNPELYRQQFPQVDFYGTADLNGDGLVNTLDVAFFIALLTGAGKPPSVAPQAVPEPASLSCLAILAWGSCRRR